MDLTTTPPRPLDAELEGYAWLPRMLDKARATLGGTAGEYLFGCPVDHTCLARLGVSADLILQLVARHDDDGEVLDALRAQGIPSAEEAWFDAPAVEDELQTAGTYLRVRSFSALPEAGEGRGFGGAEHGAGVSVVVIDAPPGQSQGWHAHPTEEVLVVHDGAVRVFLGPWQARIVRAGEVARIPAALVHRWESLGPAPLRAVAAYAGAEVVTSAAGRAGRGGDGSA